MLAIGRDFDLRADDSGGIVVNTDKGRLRDPLSLATPSLHGPHQRRNAALAALALHQALPDLDMHKAGAGSAKAIWPGRLQHLESGSLTQLVPHQPLWLDGAHNAHGASALAAALPSLSDAASWHFITGALNTRPPEEFLDKIAPLAASLYCVAIPEQPASLTAEVLAKTATPLCNAARPAASVAAALSAIATMDDSRHLPIMICGSLYLAGHVLTVNGTLPD